MTICKKCRKPLHPLSRYALIGIGPECLRKENDEELKIFLKEMNIKVSEEDMEYANDLNNANDIEEKGKRNLLKIIRDTPKIKDLLDKSSNSTVSTMEIARLDQFDENFNGLASIGETTESLVGALNEEGEDKVLEMSRRSAGRRNQELRKFGLKKYKEEVKARKARK